MDAMPENESLVRWLRLARERVSFQGLPARICWLGYGDRARAGKIFNDLVARGAVKAPIVIGRDHLDSGSVASPNRETESMRDGSDAIADWPVLNALLNTASGATWVSVHHGGGVGIGYSIHAGMVVVADGTRRRGPAARARADDRSGHRHHAPRRRGLSGGHRGGPPSLHRSAGDHGVRFSMNASMRASWRCLVIVVIGLAPVGFVGIVAAQETPRSGGGVQPAGRSTRSVEAVEAPDPSTVVFRLKWPAASFVASLASPFNWIYKADILARDIHWYEKNVMGTGPFRLRRVREGLALDRPDATRATGTAASPISTAIARSSSASRRRRWQRSAGSAR